MYRIFISDYMSSDLLKQIKKVLPADKFELASNGLDTSDLYLIEAIGEELPTSASINYGLAGIRGALPAVVIRTNSRQKSCGIVSLYRVISSATARLFDLTDGKNMEELPDFLVETIQVFEKNDGVGRLNSCQIPHAPYKGDQDYLFVSYEDKYDLVKAFPLIRKLQDEGYRVFFDSNNLVPEDKDAYYMHEDIAERIQNCSCIIALISPQYIRSQDCTDEINMARDLNKERILVFLEKTKLSPGMAMRLLRLQAIHKYAYKTRPEFYEKLFSAKGMQTAKEE